MLKIGKRLFPVVLMFFATTASLQAQIGLRTAKPVVGENNQIGLRAEGADEDCPVSPGWTPTNTDPELTRCFWNQRGQAYLMYGRFVSSAKTMSAATEIVSDAFWGLRVALSTAVAATTDNDRTIDEEDEPTPEQDQALNLLAVNGGNLAITASYPIYYRPFVGASEANEGETDDDNTSEDETEEEAEDDFGYFLWNSYVRGAANVSALGGNTESTVDFGDVNANLEVAFTEMQVDLLGHEKNINLMGYLKASAVTGTERFAKSLGDHTNKTFLQGQAGAGVRVGKVFMIYLTYNWYSDGHIPGDGVKLSMVITK